MSKHAAQSDSTALAKAYMPEGHGVWHPHAAIILKTSCY